MAATRAPGPRSRYPGATLIAFRRDPLGFLERTAREHGDVACIRFGPRRTYLLSHPDLVRDVLVTHHRRFHKGLGLERAKPLLGQGLLTAEGELHRRQRRLAQPAFHHQRVAAYGEVMARHAARLDARWRALAAAPGTVVDVHGEMMRLTLGIVGETLFGAAVEEEAREVGEAVTTVLELFERFVSLPFGDLLQRLLPRSRRRFARARGRLDATIYRLIEARRRSGEDRGDLLSMLLLARDEEGGGGMSDERLRDEAMTIFLAGHETTANALTWTWHLLGAHPEAEARLHAEVDAVLGARRPAAEDVERLSYTAMVLSEAMRLYPPAWVLGRRAVMEHEAAGYPIPRNALVLLSQWVVHRDPRWFPDPEAFLPERWTPEARAARPRFSYFPFGAGPRICIGEQFAWMEAVLALATLAAGWRLRPIAGVVPVPLPSITLRPASGLPMRLERRSRGPEALSAPA